MNDVSLPFRREITATSVGYIASSVLVEAGSVEVVGVTSRGIFLRTPSRWMVYVTGERYRSPLTITVRDDGGLFQGVGIGDSIRTGGGELVLADAGIKIKYAGCITWGPQPTTANASPVAERQKRLEAMAGVVVKQKMGTGLGVLLPQLLALGVQDGYSMDPLNPVQSGIINILPLIRAGEAAPLAEGLAGVMGAGQGLTPSGDDYIIGLLLTWNRWPDSPWSMGNLGDLNDRLIEAAYIRTTTLSANLIEIAAHSQADERLVNIVDYLVCGGDEGAKMIVDDLLGWGSSSGVDAFTGMAAALKYP